MMSLKTELMPHQRDAVNKVLPTRIAALFMQMGTGKSRTAIELVYQRFAKIDKAVWFCPVSLKETVRQEILKHTDCTDIDVFDGHTNEQNLPQTFWHIVGIESMSSSTRVVCAVNKLVTARTFVIVDESSYIKGHNAIRTMRLTEICKRAYYKLILTGTPLSQGVVDLYAQMKFLSPKILGYNSFYSFAANHLEYSDKYPGMIVRAHNLGYIAAKIKPYVYQVTKEECLDLPEKLYSYRAFYLTEEQEHWYEYVKDDILSVLEERRMDYVCCGDYFTSLAIFRLFTYLQEIASGFLNWKGKLYEFDNKRPEMLLELVRDLRGEKIVVFCKFQHDMDQIRKALMSEFGEGSVASFDGRDNERKRYAAIDQFKGSARFLVVTQATGGHGLNLQDACHYAIFYNNGFKYSERLQAEDRIHRIGQTRKPTYIDLFCSCGIERRIDEALRKKGDTVREFRREVEKVKAEKLREIIKAL